MLHNENVDREYRVSYVCLELEVFNFELKSFVFRPAFDEFNEIIINE